MPVTEVYNRRQIGSQGGWGLLPLRDDMKEYSGQWIEEATDQAGGLCLA